MKSIHRSSKPSLHWETDVPDYKVVLLRWPFLSLIFLLVCCLLALLEHALDILPHEHDRTTTPKDDSNPTLLGRSYPPPKPAATAHSLQAYGTEATGHDLSQPRTLALETAIMEPKIAVPIPVLSESLYATTGIGDIYISTPAAATPAGAEATTTFITWADRWYGDANNKTQHPYHRRPLFPGDEDRGKCVYHYQGVVMTKDKGCPAIIGGSTGPKGWKLATWISSGPSGAHYELWRKPRDEGVPGPWDYHIRAPMRIWVQEGGQCDRGYDDWAPRIDRERISRIFNLEDETGQALHSTLPLWSNCTWLEPGLPTQFGPDPGTNKVLQLYTGYPGGNFSWPKDDHDYWKLPKLPWNKVSFTAVAAFYRGGNHFLALTAGLYGTN